MVQLKNLSLVDLIEKISSSNPVPGGGSVSGILLSLAGALSAKVCSVSKKQGYLPEYDLECREIMQKGLELAEEDAEKYLKVLKSFRQKTDIEESLYQAALTPLKISLAGTDFVDISLDVSLKGNPKAITDALISSLIVQCAILGGVLNARINLEDMPDGSYKNEIVACLKETIKLYREKEEYIKSTIDAYLKILDTSK